jgi:glycosyltransferase involved in cell wall biosynthesis
MRIVIDARMYGLEHAGIGRYVVNLIDQIKKNDKKNDYNILLRKKYFKSFRPKQNNFHTVLADYPHYSLKEQVLLPLQLIKLKPDLVHFPHFNVPVFWWGRQVVTIHDLIKHQSKGPSTTTRAKPIYWLKYAAYQGLIWLAVKRAAKVIVPSQYWKKALTKKYSLQPNKVTVTYEGIGSKFKARNRKYDLFSTESPALGKPKARPGRRGREVESILRKYKIKKPFIIYTGSLYPHKNVNTLVKAVKRFRVLKQENRKLSLVVACARNVFFGRFKARVKQMKAEKFVKLAGFVPDQDLVALYQQAEAFVLPTLMEGFGLIGLEAMAAGCPVLASNIPVLKEIYGEAALYFDPLNERDIAEKIKIVTGNKKTRNRLIKLGLKQVKKYSWKDMAEKTLKVYREIVGSE